MYSFAVFGVIFFVAAVADNNLNQFIQTSTTQHPLPGFGLSSNHSPIGTGGLAAQNMALGASSAANQQPLVVDTIAGPEKVQKIEQSVGSASEAEKPLLQKAVELFRVKPRVQAFTSFVDEVEKSKLTQEQKQDLYKRVSSMTSP